jgi:hypothetical protein
VRGRLFPTEADWCEWRQEPPLPGAVFVRVARDAGGRLVLAGLRIDGPPSAELLRAIPVGRIEAAANAQLTVVDHDVVTAVAHRRPGTRPAEADAGWETTDPVRAVHRPEPRPEPHPRGTAGAAPLLAAAGPGPETGRATEAGRGRPDLFYRDIAHAYLDLAQRSTRPASELAEAHGVPVTTAHRWVKEARRRGFLPPGRPGKAG